MPDQASTPCSPSLSGSAGAAEARSKQVCGAKTKKGKHCQNPIITRFGICPVHASLVGGVRARRVAKGEPATGVRKRRKPSRRDPPTTLRSAFDSLLPLSPVSAESPPAPDSVEALRWEPALALEELYPAPVAEEPRFDADLFSRDQDDIVPLKLDLDTEPF